MKKVLINVERYLTPTGIHFNNGEEKELTTEQWEAIPERDKTLFADPKEKEDYAVAIEKLEEADNG